MSKPLIIGHRGAPAARPENTLDGFQHTMDIGADGIELDVLLTRDGIPIVTHNETLLSDTTKGPDGAWLDGPGPEISALSLAELQSYDVGACRPGGAHAIKHPMQKPLGRTPVPTLEAVLQQIAAVPRPVALFVELKHAPHSNVPAEAFVETVADLVASHGLLDDSYVHAFNWQILSAAARIAPEWRRSHLSCSRAYYPDGTLFEGSPALDGVSHEITRMLPELVTRGAANWCPFYKDLTEEALALAQSLGLKVMTWTVNGHDAVAAEIKRGVDGIMTDDPEFALSLRDTSRP